MLGGVVIAALMHDVTGHIDVIASSTLRTAVADAVLSVADALVVNQVRGHDAFRRRRALALLDVVFDTEEAREQLTRFPAAAHDAHASVNAVMETAAYDAIFTQIYDVPDATWTAALTSAGHQMRPEAQPMVGGSSVVGKSSSSNPVILDLASEREQDRQFLSTPRDIAERDLERQENQTFILGLPPGTGPDVYLQALSGGTLSVRYMLLLGVRGGGALSDQAVECATILKNLRRDARQRARSFLVDMQVPPQRHDAIINSCVSMKRGAHRSLWLVDEGHEVMGVSVGTGLPNLRARGSKGDLKDELACLLRLVGLLQPDLYTDTFAEGFLDQVDDVFRLSPMVWDELAETFYDKASGTPARQ